MHLACDAEPAEDGRLQPGTQLRKDDDRCHSDGGSTTTIKGTEYNNTGSDGDGDGEGDDCLSRGDDSDIVRHDTQYQGRERHSANAVQSHRAKELEAAEAAYNEADQEYRACNVILERENHREHLFNHGAAGIDIASSRAMAAEAHAVSKRAQKRMAEARAILYPEDSE